MIKIERGGEEMNERRQKGARGGNQKRGM